MKALKIILTTLSAIIIILLLFGWYIGFFKSIIVEEKEEGGYKVVGMEITGPYSKVGKSMMDIDKKLKDSGIICTKGFGIYTKPLTS